MCYLTQWGEILSQCTHILNHIIYFKYITTLSIISQKKGLITKLGNAQHCVIYIIVKDPWGSVSCSGSGSQQRLWSQTDLGGTAP